MAEFCPRLMEATDADERMTALCEFIEFWLGPRDPSFGESTAALSEKPLPMPLYRLYEFAGRWPKVHKYAIDGYALGLLNHLFQLDKLKTDEEGKIIFLGQTRDTYWDCRTLAVGNDPPVWKVWDDGEDPDMPATTVSESLSRFLVTFVLQELTFGARLRLCDDGLDQLFETERETTIPVWIDAPYADGSNNNFFLWKDVLVGQFSDNTWHGANLPTGIDFLTTNQGPLNEIQVTAGKPLTHVGKPWSLFIRSDGSAKLRYFVVRYGVEPIDDVAEVSAGTFDFDWHVGTLSGGLSDTGDYDRNAMVSFCRRGQGHGICKYFHDSSLVRAMFNQVLSRAITPNPALARRVAADLHL